MAQAETQRLETRVLKASGSEMGRFVESASGPLQLWELRKDSSSSLEAVREAARLLLTTDTPVAFPTETVYGLGADATRSNAVKGIYKAKGRPSDNPLIVHVCDTDMLNSLLLPADSPASAHEGSPLAIYEPLIARFWPGPLTILLPNPSPSRLAPEVTAGLATFGVRMPNAPLALSLIKEAGVPLAAPSANASTKPSPTTAEHVLHDLDGRIECILDGGPCDVGVESTVVDGLCHPPAVLRPGGISMDDIRHCEGWEGVVRGYKDQSELGSDAPRAPGMKYKHYSPRAKVILHENGLAVGPQDLAMVVKSIGNEPVVSDGDVSTFQEPSNHSSEAPKIGIVRTKLWPKWIGFGDSQNWSCEEMTTDTVGAKKNLAMDNDLNIQEALFKSSNNSQDTAHVIDIELGTETKTIARGLFSALRYLDLRGTSVILMEGIGDEGDIAAAVMNRLRKAATNIRT